MGVSKNSMTSPKTKKTDLQFDPPKLLDAAEVKNIGKKFTDLAYVDLNGDGLKEEVTTQFPLYRAQITTSVYIVNNDSTVKELNEFKSSRIWFATHDINGDKKPDIIVKSIDSKKKTTYWKMINKSLELNKPKKPSWFLIGAYDPKIKDEITYRPTVGLYSDDTEIKIKKGFVHSLKFHPSGAKYVSIAGGGGVPIPEGHPIDIRTSFSNLPINFYKSFSVDFMDKSGNSIKRFMVHHKPPKSKVLEKDGIAFRHYQSDGDFSGWPIEKMADKFIQLWNPVAGDLRRLWGSKYVFHALREVIVDEQAWQQSPSADGDLIKSGRIFYDVTSKEVCKAGTNFDRCQQLVMSHEVSHNIEFLLTNTIKFGLLQNVYMEFSRKDSLVFDFIGESKYFEEASDAGHPSSNATELFASTTNVLIGGEVRFQNNLKKWKKKLNKKKFQSLKTDLKKLFRAYQHQVKRFNPRSHFDFKPFISFK